MSTKNKKGFTVEEITSNHYRVFLSYLDGNMVRVVAVLRAELSSYFPNVTDYVTCDVKFTSIAVCFNETMGRELHRHYAEALAIQAVILGRTKHAGHLSVAGSVISVRAAACLYLE